MGDLFDSVKFYVDFLESIVYIVKKNNLAQQTDEAEVTAVMRAQRVREGESRMEMQAAKWAAEGAGKGFYKGLSILRRKAYVSCREYAGIPQSARVVP